MTVSIMAAGGQLTEDGQLEWRDTLLGVDTAYGLVSLQGWVDLPEMRNGNTPMDGRHGAHAGRVHASQRIITFNFSLSEDPAEFRQAERQLRRITAPSESPDEEPLVVQWQGVQAQVMARCIRRSIPTPVEYHYGITEGAIQWAASDPRQLQIPALTRNTALAAPSSDGLVFPLAFPLAFGGGQSGGSVFLENNGTADAWPLFTVRGPASAPQIVDATTGDRLAFASDYTVPAGQTIEIDTLLRTVVVSGTTVSRNAELLTREWFSIPPDDRHEIRFTAGTYDPDALLTATWHHTDL